MEQRMAGNATRSGASPASDPRLTTVQSALALLARQPALLAVRLQVAVGGTAYDITVSKALDETGGVLPQYVWDADRLTEDEQGQQHWERRLGLGRRSYETAEAAYQAAMEWVQAHPEGATSAG